MTKKIFLMTVALGIIFLLSACDTFTRVQPTPVVYQPAPENTNDLIIADGEIVPNNDLKILSPTNGKIKQILLEEGQHVEADQVIIQFEVPEQLQAELEAANLDLLSSTQSLDNLYQSGNLQKQQAYQRVLNAQTAKRAAMAAWDEFDEDQYNEDLEAIKEDVIDARQELEDAKEELKDYLDLEEDNPQRENRQDDVDEAQLNLNELEREQADLEQSYEQLKLDLEITRAEEETALEEYQKYKQDNIPEDRLALIEQQITSAQTRIDAIQAAINDLEISAPFEGLIVSLNIQEGEWVMAGQPLAVIADLSNWYVESTDLTELEIVDIGLGDIALLELDAFPDEVIRGKVIEIKEYPELKYNDVIYRIRIELPEHDLPLRWKMTTIIKIEK